jgi:hypothetical protein
VYPIDERDTVVELTDVPQSCIGAPMPFVVADEHILLLSYIVQQNISPDTDSKCSVAIVQFLHPLMHVLGPPNDEAIQGHPLWRRGLESYAAYRVDQSSLVRRLSVMNSVHRQHNPAVFDRFHHYVFTFHDSTFECVAQSLSCVVEQLPTKGERYNLMVEMVKARDARWQSESRSLREDAPFTVRAKWWLNTLNPWSS